MGGHLYEKHLKTSKWNYPDPFATLLEPPRPSPDLPQTSPDASKRPRSSQAASKRLPRDSQEDPRVSQEAPREPQIAPTRKEPLQHSSKRLFPRGPTLQHSSEKNRSHDWPRGGCGRASRTQRRWQHLRRWGSPGEQYGNNSPSHRLTGVTDPGFSSPPVL